MGAGFVVMSGAPTGVPPPLAARRVLPAGDAAEGEAADCRRAARPLDRAAGARE